MADLDPNAYLVLDSHRQLTNLIDGLIAVAEMIDSDNEPLAHVILNLGKDMKIQNESVFSGFCAFARPSASSGADDENPQREV